MSQLRCAVIGVGYLGRFHAQKYAQLEDCDLVAVADTHIEAARSVAQENNCEALSDYRDLHGKVDAISIVVPTPGHYEIANEFLQRGTHVLVEKPITDTVEHAERLVQLAEEKQRILQVGHLERFNSAILALEKHIEKPRFIESHRLAPFRPRGTDVSVVLDLMIHDIDIILSMVKSELADVHAVGMKVLSQDIDIANARLVFENGCVANVTASRVSSKTERKLRVFQQNAYLSADLGEHHLSVYQKANDPIGNSMNITSNIRDCGDQDALKAEITDFVRCINEQDQPIVSGHDALRALRTASRITELVNQSL